MAVELDPRRGERPARRTRRASVPRACASWSATRRGRDHGERLRPRAGRPAVLGPRHAPVAPRRALAKDTRSRSRQLRTLQRRILDAGAAAVRPGGRLVYSTCTISAPENERQMEEFLGRRRSRRSGLIEQDGGGFVQTLPHRDGTDGFFIAAFETTWMTSSTGTAPGQPRAIPFDLGPQLPELRRALAAPDPARRALPLRLLPDALSADVPLPGLRRALDDRAHERHATRWTCVRCGGSMLKPV